MQLSEMLRLAAEPRELSEQDIDWCDGILRGVFNCAHCASKVECKGDDAEAHDVCGDWKEE